MVGWLQSSCNFISCIILGLVLMLFRKITKSVQYGRDQISQKLKFNKSVTIGHISLILALTISSLLIYNFNNYLLSKTYLRIRTSWTLIGGLCDLCLTCMTWFIFDKDRTPTVFKSGQQSYAVLEVIK